MEHFGVIANEYYVSNMQARAWLEKEDKEKIYDDNFPLSMCSCHLSIESLLVPWNVSQAGTSNVNISIFTNSAHKLVTVIM